MIITSDYVEADVMDTILAALMPANRLALKTSMVTGLRIDDVLSLKTSCLDAERFTVKEHKTAKSRRIRLPNALRCELFAQAGRFYVFEGRNDPKRHRTRQAVFKDLNRACKLFRVRGVHISPHTARKIYAVNQMRKTDLRHVQQLLNHESEAVTIIYAMADELTARKTAKKAVKLPNTRA